jgi:hypothetical protein
MANEWIKERAEREAKADAETKQRVELQLRKQRLVESLGAKFLKTLMDDLNQAIVEWNITFKDKQVNGAGPIQGSNGAYSVDKFAFPRGSAFFRFDPESSRIEVKLQRTRPMDGSMYDHETFFCLEPDMEFRDIHMEDQRHRHVTSSQFCQMVIESIADPMSHHLI